jgi:hypothetical protein
MTVHDNVRFREKAASFAPIPCPAALLANGTTGSLAYARRGRLSALFFDH